MRFIERAARGRLHYGWIAAAVTFLVLFMAAGVRATPGVLIVPLEDEFGWTRASISLAVSVNLLLYGLIGPFAATLMDRFGLRRSVAASLGLVVVGVGLTTVMRTSWQLVLLWGVVVGVATGSTAMVLGAMVANRWFVRRRGLVMGLLTAAGASGQLVFLPLLASLAVASGWRAASLCMAGAVLLLVPIVAVLMRGGPDEVGLAPYGAAPGDLEPARPAGNPVLLAFSALRLGLGSRQFWLLAGSFFVCGATTNGLIGTHLIPASHDHGIPEVTAASMLGVLGVFNLIGVIISGWLTDRVDPRYLLCCYYTFRGLALVYLPYALGSHWLALAAFTVIYGLDWVATGPPTVRLTADLFGKRDVGVMFGWINAAHQVGGALAAFGGGAARTWLGDYQVAFMTAGLLGLVAAGLVLRIVRAPALPIPRLVPAPSLAAS